MNATLTIIAHLTLLAGAFITVNSFVLTKKENSIGIYWRLGCFYYKLLYGLVLIWIGVYFI